MGTRLALTASVCRTDALTMRICGKGYGGNAKGMGFCEQEQLDRISENNNLAREEQARRDNEL